MISESQLQDGLVSSDNLESPIIRTEEILPCESSPPIRIDYFLPDEDIRDFVSSFYIAEINVDFFDEYERADRPQFRFLNRPDGSYSFSNGESFSAYRANIIGPTSGKVRAVQRGCAQLFGFGLLPAGWGALVGASADKLTDRAIDAVDIFGPWISEIADAIEAAPDAKTKLIIGNNLVRAITAGAERAPMWFIHIVDHWLTSAPSPQISDLVAAAGMSLRSIERMTKIYYGLSPRMLARKYRALRAASLLALGENLDSYDVANGFYDQSHLIREVKHFAGATPRQLRNASPYVAAAVQGRKSMSGKVPPIISET